MPERLPFRAYAAILALISGTLSVGCVKPLLRVEISGPPDINQGIPFNLLVRAVSVQQFRSDAYATVSQLIAQRDESVLYSDVVFTPPGQPYDKKFLLPPLKEGGYGVYFLFTTPTGRWRLLLEPPLPRRLRVRLGASSILASEMEGSLAGGSLPEVPEIKLPEGKPPALPEVKAPEVNPPEVKAPEVKAPEMKAPAGG